MDFDSKVLMIEDDPVSILVGNTGGQRRLFSKLAMYMAAYGSVITIQPTPDYFSSKTGMTYDHIIIDEVPECVPFAEEDNTRSKDNFRPASDWNYLNLRKKRF